MRYPKPLGENGTIGFVAPSFGCSTEPYRSYFENAQKKFAEMGYRISLGPNCYEDSGIGKSNSPEKCAEEINSYFTGSQCDVIISCGGGETMCEDLPYVDFDAIKRADPKWFMGYSDNTNLTFTLPTLCDTAAVYGPCARGFGMEPWHKSLSDAFGILTGEVGTVENYPKWEKEEKAEEEKTRFEGYNATEDYSSRIFVGEKELDKTEFSGRLIGGCLDCLSILCGTKFDKAAEFADRYSDDGIIWFIEACELMPFGIKRALWQLENAGWFSNVSGFIIGRPYNYDAEEMGLDRISSVTGMLAKYNVPVVLDADFGHLHPMMPIVAGAVGTVRAEKTGLELQMKYI